MNHPAAGDPAVFLDRDGVIIENRAAYIRRCEDIVFIPGALQALARLSSSPYRVVIVTNQSVVGRGLISLLLAEEINREVVAQIERAGGRIDGAFICPHAPEEHCLCRKPRPGLILQAARELDIDLSGSIMIGDALSDLLAGQEAGVGRKAMVRTGRGEAQSRLPFPPGLEAFRLYNDLGAVIDELVRGEEKQPVFPMKPLEERP